MKKIYDGLQNFIEKYYWFFFAGIAAVTVFLCFYRLDAAYVSSWDEARHGVSAYEMMQSGNYIVNTFGYEPDYWNLKPPLSFYSIILGFKIFGYSVIGLRFFSALSYVLTSLAIGLFLKKYNKLSSLLGMGFLLCNCHIFRSHGARSGDADALYLLFFVLAMLAMLEISKKHSKLYICGFCFAGAFLCKSFHAGVIAAVGGMYLLLTGEIKKIKPKEWLYFLLSVFVPIGIWAAARFSQDGTIFFKEMFLTDVLSRSSSASEGHAGVFLYYYELFFKEEMVHIYPYLCLAIVFGGIWQGVRAFKNKTVSREAVNDGIGYILWLVITFLFYSSVSTKLDWYGFPILISLDMMAAVLIGKFLTEKSPDEKAWSGIVRISVMICFICLIIVKGHDTYQASAGKAHGDEPQSFLVESVERDSTYAGMTAYIDLPYQMGDGTEWNQNMRFLAEISGDFHCEDGGTEAFLKDDEAVLYMSRDRYEEKNTLLGETEIIYEQGNYLLLIKTENVNESKKQFD